MTARQFYIVLAISVITMKMQKLPSLVSDQLGKDSWLLFLVFTLINILGICFVFFIIQRVDLKTILNSSKKPFINFFRIILMLFLVVYFLVQAILIYEHIQALFSNTLFDDLSWPLFSLLLLFAVFFLAHRGIENISLNMELFVWIIVVSFVILTLLGVGKTDYSVILPFETIDFKTVISKLQQFICWFGDFFLVLFLSIKARDIKLSKTLFVYIISMLFMSFLVVVFIGIYDKTAPLAPGLISVISEQALLDLSIGRVDWFLILFTEMGAIMACGVNLYFANLTLHSAFPKARSVYLKIMNIVILYIFDVFLLVDLNTKIQFFCGVMNNVSICVIVATLFILFCLAIKQKQSRKNQNLKQNSQISSHSTNNKNHQKEVTV